MGGEVRVRDGEWDWEGGDMEVGRGEVQAVKHNEVEAKAGREQRGLCDASISSVSSYRYQHTPDLFDPLILFSTKAESQWVRGFQDSSCDKTPRICYIGQNADPQCCLD